jgi:ABC-type transport system involved in multi-copper enzyme maturation permease subunit
MRSTAEIQAYADRTGRPAPPSPVAGAGVMISLAVRELVLSRKTLLVVLLGALLVAAAVLQNVLLALGFARRVNVPMMYGFLVTEAFIRFFLPVVSLFYAAALVTDEVDGRTLTYLATRPVDKRLILYGKFAGFVIVAAAILEATLALCWLAFATSAGISGLGAHLGLLLRDGVATVMGLLAYGAFFTLLGALLRKPVIPGLVFMFVWEQIVSFVPGSAQRLTILHYLQSLTPHQILPGDELPFLSALSQEEHPLLAAGVLGLASVVLLVAAGEVFRSREYRLEK